MDLVVGKAGGISVYYLSFSGLCPLVCSCGIMQLQNLNGTGGDKIMRRLVILISVLLLLTACGRAAISPEVIREGVIDEVVSYHPGTAGSSLKQALAAANLLSFATEQEVPKSAYEKAWNETDAATQEYFRENFEGLSWLITTALKDYDSVSGEFEDAGAAEVMASAMNKEGAEKSWDALRSVIEDVLSSS